MLLITPTICKHSLLYLASIDRSEIPGNLGLHQEMSVLFTQRKYMSAQTARWGEEESMCVYVRVCVRVCVCGLAWRRQKWQWKNSNSLSHKKCTKYYATLLTWDSWYSPVASLRYPSQIHIHLWLVCCTPDRFCASQVAHSAANPGSKLCGQESGGGHFNWSNLPHAAQEHVFINGLKKVRNDVCILILCGQKRKVHGGFTWSGQEMLANVLYCLD